MENHTLPPMVEGIGQRRVKKIMALDQNTFKEMEKRVGRQHLSKRLSRQVQHSAIQFGDAGFKFHLEHCEPVFIVLRMMLKCLGLLDRGMKNALDYRVEKITVALGNLPKSFKNFRILQLSDIHMDGIPDQGERLREKIAGLQFDLCVITGDFRFLTFYDYEKAVGNMERLVESLRCECGILGILGNHDFIEMVPLLEATGIKMLLNEAERAGVKYYLSGHTHGGQICLPGGIPVLTNAHCPRRFVSGPWQYDKMQGYTSRGTGSSGLAVRYFCPPEITLHRFISV